MKRGDIYRLIGFIFVVIGLTIMAAGAAVFIKTNAFVDEAVEVKGKVSRIDTRIDLDGETNYTAYVTYKYEGKEYKNIRLNEYSSSLYEGKAIELYLDKDDFSNARLKSMVYLLAIIFAGIGIIFLIIGAVILIIGIKLKGKRKKLKESGVRIYAQVQGGFLDTTYTYKGRHPYRLECVYYDERSGQPVICTSDIIWESPDKYIGKYVSVYADREDKSRYMVDLENIQAD